MWKVILSSSRQKAVGRIKERDISWMTQWHHEVAVSLYFFQTVFNKKLESQHLTDKMVGSLILLSFRHLREVKMTKIITIRRNPFFWCAALTALDGYLIQHKRSNHFFWINKEIRDWRIVILRINTDRNFLFAINERNSIYIFPWYLILLGFVLLIWAATPFKQLKQ